MQNDIVLTSSIVEVDGINEGTDYSVNIYSSVLNKIGAYCFQNRM